MHAFSRPGGGHQTGGGAQRMTCEHKRLLRYSSYKREQIVPKNSPVLCEILAHRQRGKSVSALIAGDDMKSIGKRRKKPAVGFGIETVGVREQNRAPARIRPFEARHRAISEIDGLSHRI